MTIILGDFLSKFPNKLFIIRHAQSERNLERERMEKYNSDQLMFSIKKRDKDIELTDKGKEQVLKTAKALKNEKIDLVFTSPYLRTKQTTELLLNGMNISPEYRIDDRLREKEWGILDMYTKKGIMQKYPEEYERRKREGKYYYRPPGGESYADIGLRLYSFMGSLIRSGSNKNVLIVTHSVVVKMFRKVIEKLEEEDILNIDKENDPSNCGVTYYQINPKTDKLNLVYYNKIFY